MERCPKIAFLRARDPDELALFVERVEADAIVLAGWSWILDKELLERNLVVGLHPSDLPAYAGGSPLQHQILDGVTESKLSLFRVTPDLDQGPVISKQDLSLRGHLDEIFDRIVEAGVTLLVPAFDELAEIAAMPEEPPSDVEKVENRRRLRPELSRIEKADFQSLTNRELFNLIRAREAPYPNVYVEDETGRLYFSRVEFVEK